MRKTTILEWPIPWRVVDTSFKESSKEIYQQLQYMQGIFNQTIRTNRESCVTKVSHRIQLTVSTYRNRFRGTTPLSNFKE